MGAEGSNGSCGFGQGSFRAVVAFGFLVLRSKLGSGLSIGSSRCVGSDFHREVYLFTWTSTNTEYGVCIGIGGDVDGVVEG